MVTRRGDNGDDRLNGTGDDDRLLGRGGNDLLRGRGGDDELLGGDDNDLLTGSSGNDQLKGGSGNDILIGGTGDDEIDPGSNTGDGDRIIGGRGDDTINFAGGGRFRLDYEELTRDLTIELGDRNGSVDKGSWGTDTLRRIDRVRNGDGLTLSTGVGNDLVTIDVGEENARTRVVDFRGDDTFIGGGGYVQLRFAANGLRGVSVTVTGYDSEGRMNGEAIDGFGGGINTFQSIDEIEGSAAADTLIGGDEGDSFFTGFGDNTVDGGGGNDVVIYNAFEIKKVRVNLETGEANGKGETASFTDSLANIENVRATINGNDRIIGSDEDNNITTFGGRDRIEGGGGDDDLSGGSESDEIRGGSGNDSINGGTDADLLLGGSGDDLINASSGRDVLKGGAGDDRLIGGAGADKLTGNSGADRFEFSDGDGEDDVIRDFTDGEDLIRIAGADEFGDLTIRNNGGDATVRFEDLKVTLLDVGANDLGDADFLFN